jgi:hypothetical protein
MLLRAKTLYNILGFNKIQGKPFLVSEIEEKIVQIIKDLENAENNIKEKK